VPSTVLPCAPAPAGSSSGSGSRSAAGTGLWVTSNGTHTPRPASWRGWRTRPWKRLLSGTTLPPSTAQAGVDAWTSSLRGSRANRSRSPGSDGESTTTGGSGRTSPGWSVTWDPGSCSWRTSPRCSDDPGRSPRSEPFLGTWPASGSMRSGVCSERTRWAPPIVADGCSSWVGDPAHGWWPTPTSTDASSGGWGTREGLRNVARSHHARVMSPGGGNLPGLVLNPRFCELLMGWPDGWTGCDASATGSYRSWLRSLSCTLVDVLASSPVPPPGLISDELRLFDPGPARRRGWGGGPSPWTRAMLDQLGDGAWHHRDEVIDHCAPFVPDDYAYRYGETDRRKAGRRPAHRVGDRDQGIAVGSRRVISATIRRLRSRHRVETNGPLIRLVNGSAGTPGDPDRVP